MIPNPFHGDYMDFQATGNKIDFTSIITCRVENGMIVEERVSKLTRQAGTSVFGTSTS